MSELSPCPFCGGDNNVVGEQAHSINTHVTCLNCYAKSSAFIDKSKAIESWHSVTPNAKIKILIYQSSQIECSISVDGAYEYLVDGLLKLIKPEGE